MDSYLATTTDNRLKTINLVAVAGPFLAGGD